MSTWMQEKYNQYLQQIYFGTRGKSGLIDIRTIK